MHRADVKVGYGPRCARASFKTLTSARCNNNIAFLTAGLRFKTSIEDLNLRPAVKKAVILLLYRTDVKVLKDALAHLGPCCTLTSVQCSDPGG